MIIEPTPTNSRSPVRRTLRRAALIVPVALLVAVVGVGLLGSRPGDRIPRPPPTTAPSRTAPAIASPAASAPPVDIADIPPEPPAQFGDLRTMTPSELQEIRGEVGTARALALTGFLRIDGQADGTCIDEAHGPLGPWCEREGTLGDRPWATLAAPAGVVAPHVHLSIPIGVRLPASIATPTGLIADGGARVLVVGRFGRGIPDCSTPTSPCDALFIVERFAWIDGVRVGLTPLVETRLDTGERRPNPFAFLDAADLPLQAVLVWPDAVAALDPAAATVAQTGPPSEPVWYVRILDGARGPGMARNVRWMLLAERDLRVLGAGRLAAGAGG